MIIFRWQAHDSRVEMGVSPQRNINFSHQGLKKKHLIFEVFIWRDLKLCVSLQRNPHFWHPGFPKNLAKFPFSFGICVMWGTCGHHLFHSMPQGLAQSLHIQHIFTFGVMSPHIAVRPFEPHWIYHAPPHPTPVQRADVLAAWSA